MKRILLSLIFLLSIGLQVGKSAPLTFTGTGNWSTLANWGGTLPTTGDDVTISAGSNCTVDITTDVLNSITVNGNLTIINLASAALMVGGNVTVAANCSLINNGYFEVTVNGSIFTLGANSTYTHNPRINTTANESMFEFCDEVFAPTSNLNILKWASTSIPLFDINPVNPRISWGMVPNDIGNLTLSVAGTFPWEQNGLFQNRVKGTFNLTAGVLRMDDGTGNSTSLIFQDVFLTGASNIIFQEGPNRALNITTGTFSNLSTSTDTMIVMNGKVNDGLGPLTWNVNGDFIMRHNFIGIYNPDSVIRTGNNVTMNVTGNMTIGGNNNMRFDILKQVTGNVTVSVGQTFSIVGPTFPTWVRFMDSGTGNLNFTSQNLSIAGGNGNTLMGGSITPAIWPLPTGSCTVNVTNDFTISGTSVTYFVNNPVNVSKVRVAVGNDFIISSNLADYKAANTSGPVSFITGGNLTMNGGYFDGQLNTAAWGLDSIFVGGNYTFNATVLSNYFKGNAGAGATIFHTTGNFTLTNSGTAVGQGVYGNYTGNGNVDFEVGGTYTHTNGQFNGIYNGTGNFDFTSGPFIMTTGYFKGINNLATENAGIPSFTIQNLIFNGGSFIAFNACNISSATHNFSVTNNIAITYAAVSDVFMFNGVPLVNSNANTMGLNLTVGGNMSTAGVNGTFISSKGFGNETIAITGNLSFGGGNNSFNFIPNSGYSEPHNVVMTVGGNLSHSAGTTYLSGEVGDINVTVTGDVNINGGTLSIKGSTPYTAPVAFDVLGGYTQSAGSFIFYNNPTQAHTFNNLQITVNINSNDDPVGDFTQTGGTINFDINVNSTVVDSLIIKSPNYNISGGSITHAGAGTSSVFGMLRFGRTGTTLFTRPGGLHNIQQIKQVVSSGTTVEVTSGDFQIASHVSTGLDFLDIRTGSVVFLRLNSQIKSNMSSTYTGLFMGNNARLRIQHTSGLYNGTATAAFNSGGNLNYYLHPSSVVEYCGDDSQWLTGIGVAIATLSQHKYGILDINFGGTYDFEYVHPVTVGTVSIRTQLVLTKGELSLSDHNPLAGVPILIESGLPTAITRIGTSAPNQAFIRSETSDGNGKVRWNIGTNNLLHEIPFGYNSSNFYIPFRYTAPAGTTGELQAATYHTIASNIPLPPTVGHVNNTAGANNSLNVIDRFWYVNIAGTATNVTLTLTPANGSAVGINEIAGVATPWRAQKYNTGNNGWDNPFQGGAPATTIMTGYTTHTTNAINSMNGWWTLVSQVNPLPVNLLSFDAKCNSAQGVNIKWITASETNSDYFELEKSSDGHNYSFFRKAKGMGTTAEKTNYEVIDQEPFDKITYYRLKQFDFNGDSEQFEPASVYACNQDKFKVIYTSVADDKLKIVATSPVDGSFALELYDLSGKPIHNSTIKLHSGVNDIYINNLNIAGGIYVFRLTGSNENFATRIPVIR